jgi:tetratricopeptide (TPR) repeat protein
MNPLKLILQMAVALVLSLPVIVVGDQTDQRLEDLFQTLRSSQDSTVLLEAESSIWDIWYDSGQADVDRLLVEAAELMSSGQLADAESIYSRVIAVAPNFSEGWNRRATVRYYQRDYTGSLDDIEQTLKLEPRHFGAIWGLGMILGSQRDYQRAILAFERLLEIKPHASDARPRIELLKQELTKESV